MLEALNRVLTVCFSLCALITSLCIVLTDRCFMFLCTCLALYLHKYIYVLFIFMLTIIIILYIQDNNANEIETGKLLYKFHTKSTHSDHAQPIMTKNTQQVY